MSSSGAAAGAHAVAASAASERPTERRYHPKAPVYAVAVTVVDWHAAADPDASGDSGPRVLMIRRGTEPKKGFWSLPGGKVELGETTADAASRELVEECALDGAAVAVHPRPFTVTDVVIQSGDADDARSDGGATTAATNTAMATSCSDGPDTGRDVAWHYAIAQCYGRASAHARAAAAPGDDADAVKWFTLDELAEIEATTEGAVRCFETVSLAIQLDRLGVMRPG